MSGDGFALESSDAMKLSIGTATIVVIAARSGWTSFLGLLPRRPLLWASPPVCSLVALALPNERKLTVAIERRDVVVPEARDESSRSIDLQRRVRSRNLAHGGCSPRDSLRESETRLCHEARRTITPLDLPRESERLREFRDLLRDCALS